MFNDKLHRKRPACRGLLIGLAVLLVFFPSFTRAERFEEIVVGFDVPRLVTRDLIVQYDGESVYLPLVEIFNALGINIKADLTQKIFSGQFYRDRENYELNLNLMKYKFQGREIVINRNEFVLAGLDVYLKTSLFYDLFGLDMTFDFSTLTVHAPLDKDFPAYRKQMREMAHRKLVKDVTELRDLQHLEQRREYFKGAAVDWMLSASPLGSNKTQYYSFGLGGMILGGDFNTTLTGNSEAGLQTDQMNYRWHYFVGENSYLTQVDLGDIYSTGAFSRGLTGIKVTNKPQVQRKYFQTIQLSDHLGQGWEVELYLNNKLVDYAFTDQNGNYNFIVDIYYGSSRMMLKMYGPNGEILTREEFVKVPYNLIPQNTVEYSLGAGKTSNINEEDNWYSLADGYYGILRNLTVGASADLPLNGAEDEKPLAGGEVTYQPTGDLTVNGFFSPSYKVTGNINYSKPSLISANGSFTKFYENEFRNKAEQDIAVKLSLSSPLKIKDRYIGLRYAVNYDKYATMDVVNMNYGFSASVSRFNINYIGNYKISRYTNRSVSYITSQILLTPELLRWVRPQFRIDYDHTDNQITSYGIYLTRRLFKTGQLSFSFRRNVFSKSNLIMLTFNIFNSFANFSSKLLFSDRQVSMSQVQKGSVRYNQDATNFRFDRGSSVGYGTAVLRPFMDNNFNGVYDKGEEYLENLQLKVKGMGGKSYGSSMQHYYDRLRPYQEYVFQIDPNSLDNPLLKPVHENYTVKVNPNVVTSIDIPLVIGGEVSGYVQRKTLEGEVGIGGIKIMFLNMTTETVTEVSTFNNGDFYYLGLIPGRYRAYIDNEQLETYGYVSDPVDIEFEVEMVEGGAIIDDVGFKLVPKE
ncbi:MAG: hypothetical protein ACOYVF_06285 [Candidatus Zixiibacteriota bacterium]